MRVVSSHRTAITLRYGVRTAFTLYFVLIGEGYKPVLRCFSKEAEYHIVITSANLTTLNNKDAENWAMTTR